MKHYHLGQLGFTLVEAMVVVIILGILAAFAVPSFGKMLSDQATQKGAEDIINIFNEARAQSALIGKNFNLEIEPHTNNRKYSVTYTDKNNSLITVHQYTLEDRLVVTTNAPNDIKVLPLGTIVSDEPVLVFRICDGEFAGEDGYTVWINSLGIARAHSNKIANVGNDADINRKINLITDVDCPI